MKDYHFENDHDEFDTTIRLDDINEKLKDLEQKPASLEDELGDKDDFLNAFESEKFDPLPPAEDRERETSYAKGQTPRRKNVPQPEDAFFDKEPPFWNKKTIGLVTGGGILVMILMFLAVKMLFFGGFASKPIASEEGLRPVLVESLLQDGEMLVYDIEAEEQRTVTMTVESRLTDEKDAEISQSEIAEGDLLMMEFDKTGETVIFATYGDKIKQEEVTGLSVDTGSKRLYSDDYDFSYEKRTVFLYNEEEISPSDLEPCDVLLLSGLDDTVWRAEVLEYHGYIKVENKNEIKEGTFQLDEEEPVALEDVDKIAVSEGNHTITVEGENIETRKDSIFVESGEEFVYDLSKAQEKVGVLVVNANVSDYKLYINGTQTDSTSPTVLPMGEYDVLILKSGYQDWNQKVVLDQDTVTIHANLEREVQYGTVVIACDVEAATVTIDGNVMGTTPLQTNLTYGEHEILIQKEGYADYYQTVTVETTVTHVNAIL